MNKAGKTKMDKLMKQVVEELAAIGLTRATEVVSLENGELKLQPSALQGKLPAAAIASIEKTSVGWKIKFYDKLKALELLGEHLTMPGSGGKPTQENNLLEAIVKSTGEVIDTGDLLELQQASAAGNDLVEPT